MINELLYLMTSIYLILSYIVSTKLVVLSALFDTMV